MNEMNDVYEERSEHYSADLNIEKAKDPKTTALRLMRCLLKQKSALLIVVISILIGSLFEIVSPRVLGIAINEIYEGVKKAALNGEQFSVSLKTLGTVLVLLLVLYLLRSISFIQ